MPADLPAAPALSASPSVVLSPVVSPSVRLVARLMWLMPAILVAAAIGLAQAPLELSKTLREGTPAIARVVAFETTERSEVSFDALTVRAPLPSGDSLTQTIPLPHGVAPLVSSEATVPVRVLPGSARPIVIETATVESNRGPVVWNVGGSQVRIAILSCVLCIVGAVLLAIGVGSWNRYLTRHGDPGERTTAVA